MRRPFIPLRSFFRDSVIRNSIFWSGILAVSSLLLLLVFYHRLPPIAPLFYSLARGEKQLAKKQFLIILPFASLTFFIVHTWLAKFNFSSDRMLARILATTSALISFLFLVSLAHIIIIIT